MRRLAWAALLAAAGSGLARAQESPVALKGARILTVSGEDLESGTLTLRGGKIESVGKEAQPAWDGRVVDASRKVIVPAFVEAHSFRGMDRANERMGSVPFVSTFDAINPVDPYFEDCLRQGIATVHVSPGNDTMFGGQSCVVHPVGVTTESMIVARNAFLKISLRPRAGVSRMAHLASLRKELDEAAEQLKNAKGGEPDPRREPLVRLLKGVTPAFVFCPSASDVHRALELAEAYKFRMKLVLGRDGWKAAGEIAKAKLEVVLPSELAYWETDEDTHEEVRRFGAGAFSKLGVKYALQTEASLLGGGLLWYQAALAVRQGVPRAEALKASTLWPAEILGLGARLGSIEKGKDATFVLLTGDPLDAQTWVDQVWVDGKVVYDRTKDQALRRILETRR
jgi:imidazolonepropionase-like amidohydrolase